MMGVGFAREADLQPDGTPEKNPFINITQIRTAAGLAAVPAGFTNGYVVGRGGVTLGLTAADTAGAAFVKLLPDANIAREWQAAPGGVTVNGVSGSGASLVDTGVNKMFLAPPAGTGLVVAQPVPAGTRIGISLPGTGVDGFATYAFTWGGEATALTPADLIIPHGTTPFVNTGRYVLNSFDVIFDSANGYIGYRLREGATGGASLTPALGLQGTVPLPDLFLSSLPVRLLADTTLSSAGTVGLSGGIAGGHALGLTGGGTFNLAGDGTYTGGTRVGAGTTLALATGTEIGSAPVTLDGGTLSFGADTGLANAIALTAAGGTLQPNRRTLTVAGEVSGVGALTIRGPGVTYLGARGTQSGGTRITDGAVVQVFIDATLGAPAAPLTLDGGTLVGVQSFLSYRPVVIGPSGGTFWAGPGIILEFFGDVTQQGPVSMPGPGGVYLRGKVTSGAPIALDDGLVAAHGTVSAPFLMVGARASLGGTGTVNAPTAIAGTLAPGASPGTLTFTAPVALLPGARFAVELDGPGTGTGASNFDRVLVLGAANGFAAAGTVAPRLRGIPGGTNAFTPAIGQGFAIVQAEGGVQGQFDAVAQPGAGQGGSASTCSTAPTPSPWSPRRPPTATSPRPACRRRRTRPRSARRWTPCAPMPVRAAGEAGAVFGSLYGMGGAALPGCWIASRAAASVTGCWRGWRRAAPWPMASVSSSRPGAAPPRSARGWAWPRASAMPPGSARSASRCCAPAPAAPRVSAPRPPA